MLTRLAQEEVYDELLQTWHEQQWNSKVHGCGRFRRAAHSKFKSYCYQQFGGRHWLKFLIAVGSDEGQWMHVAKAATDAVVAARLSERKQQLWPELARVESKPPNEDDRQAPCGDKLPVGVGTKSLTRLIRLMKYQLNGKNLSWAQKGRLQSELDELESQYQQQASLISDSRAGIGGLRN